MRRIKSAHTTPELTVRRLAWRLGYRYRLHKKDLPGKPDLVFPAKKAVIFVHGCFWHQHPKAACQDSRLPKSRQDYWLPKLARNQQRDKEHQKALKKLGWRVLVIWDCETRHQDHLEQKLLNFLR